MPDPETEGEIAAVVAGLAIGLASLGLAVWLDQTWVVQGLEGVAVAWAIGIGTEMWVAPFVGEKLEDRYA